MLFSHGDWVRVALWDALLRIGPVSEAQSNIVTRRKKRNGNAVFTAHSCQEGECLYALAGLVIPCTYLFFKHVPRSFAPKQRRHFEIFRKDDGLSLVHLLGIKAVTLKS